MAVGFIEPSEPAPPSEENIELRAPNWDEFLAGLQPVHI